MASFSIDEVRESFSADMTQFLEEIDAAAGVLVSSLASIPASLDASERPPFEAIAARAHAVAGTGSLVGALSLSETGKRVEALTRIGQIALERARVQLARASRIAELCGAGAKAMQSMLALELDHRGAEAGVDAEAWAKTAILEPIEELRTGELRMLRDEEAAPPEIEPGQQTTSPGEFSFEDTPTGNAAIHGQKPSLASHSTPAPEAMAMEQELQGIFRQELRDSISVLQDLLHELQTRPDDLAAAGQIERMFHTLKGAAATVGLTEISTLAASLQARVEEAVESGLRVSPELLNDIAYQIDHLLDMAGMPAPARAQPEASDSRAPGSEGPGSAQALFVQEAQAIIEEASRKLAELPALAAGDASLAQASLGKLFHRLKGSSLVAGNAQAADVAAGLQEHLESGATLDIAELKNGLVRLGALIGTLGEPSAPRPASAPIREDVAIEKDPDLWGAFNQECAELLEGLEKDVLGLEDSGEPKDLLQALMRQHHTLKGAANSVGLAPTGRLLHHVEDFLEKLLDAPVLPSMKGIVTFLLEVQAEVRKHLATAPQGFVVTTLGTIETRIQGLLAGPRAVEPQPSPSSSSQAGAQTGSALSVVATEQRRFIRVAAEQLDSLMNLAGELVVSRSRLVTRVSTLRTTQHELNRSQRRLVDQVEDFVGKHEFAHLDGRSKAPWSKEPVARTPKESFAQFGELELDRYDDVHILSRSLAEISDDLGEIFRQLVREMKGVAEDADTFGSIVSGIQREVTRARMVPLESVFKRLHLPVRDAAARERKEVRVAVSGEEVNLDKTIADAVLQPMLHLVRNAVVHGIENAEEREAAGKSAHGTVVLGARQESGQIVLEVKDDGRGLDLTGLHARGVAMGFISPATPLTDPIVKDLVFAPGLSTSSAAGMVSGRGIGCDVVRRAIERLNGSIRVDTNSGVGTTFVITLPLTLAITRALLVRHAERSYAIPLFFAEHLFELEEARVAESLGGRRMKIGESFVPVRSLGDFLPGTAKTRTDGSVLVLRVGEQRVAMQVDSVIAQEEIVVKSMGELLSGHPLFAGVTIRGNGELVLIVDVPSLVEKVAGATPKTAPVVTPVPAAPPPASSSVASAASAASAPSAAIAVASAAPSGPPSAPSVVPDMPTRTLKKTPALAPKPPPADRDERRSLLRVLFVDDSISVRKVAERALRGLGVDVVVAVDGLDALEKLRAETFDLVFTDLEMPRMHGYELIRELRFLPAYRTLPVVVVSSRSGQKHQDQARALGATDYLTKPFNAESLDLALKQWVPRKTTPSGGKEPP